MEVFRTALKPRWLALFGVLVVAVATCLELGLWQLNVARDSTAQDVARAAPTQEVVPIGDLVGPSESFPSGGSGRRVTATGTYAADRQFLVAPRRLDGVTGWWVVTPLVEASTGASLPVVRGFAAEATGITEPPTGQVTVTGTLAPSESQAEQSPQPPPGGDEAAYPGGVAGALDLAVLVNRWSGDVFNLFVFTVDDGAAPVAGLERIPPPVIGGTSLNFRNTAYALQWWVFGLFAVYMWWRMVSDDHEIDQALLAAATPEGDSGPDPGGSPTPPRTPNPTDRADQEVPV